MTTQVVTQMSVITGDNKKNTPLIAGSVIGVVAVLFILIWAALTCFRRYLRSSRRQWFSRPDDISMPSSSPQSNPADKLEAEWEKIRTHAPTDIDHDHQERVTDRDGDEQDGGQTMGRVSMIDSLAIGPPPSYRS